MRCVWCNQLLAESWSGYEAHFRHYHPDFDPETGLPRKYIDPKQKQREIVDRVEKRLGKDFFLGQGGAY